MKPINTISFQFTPGVRLVLAGVALAGLIGPNGWFLWQVATNFPAIQATLQDPVALVFIGEAAGLMLLLTWLIHLTGRRNGWWIFLILSLGGGLIFSVPAWLWLASRAPATSQSPSL